MPTTNLGTFERQTKKFEDLVCSPSLAGGLQQQSVYFTAVHILLSLMAFLGNFLILIALHKVSSLRPPSVPLFGSNWSVSWYCQPAFHCHLLDVLGSRRVVSLSICIQSNVHNSLCIMLSVFVDNRGHKRRQTSRPVVGAKIQTIVLHGSNLLGTAWCRWFMLHFRLPNRYVVWPYNYTILPHNLSRLVHKDFLRSQSALGSSRTTTTEPTKSTKHFAIQKGSV